MGPPFQDVPLQIVAQFNDTKGQLVEVIVLLDHNQESIAIVNMINGKVTTIDAIESVNQTALAMKAEQMTGYSRL